MVEAFERRIANSEYTLSHENCPCGADDDTIVAEVDRYGLPLTTALCEKCGTLRTNPYLDDNSLSDFYRMTYQAMYARAPRLEQYFQQQFAYGVRIASLYERELLSPASILEAGCGAGGGLAAFQSRGHRAAGYDLSRELIEFGKNEGLENLWHGTMDGLPSQLASQRWDLIYLHHVFEHVRNPAAELRSLSRLLAPGGRILVIVPDIMRVNEFPNPAGDILRFLHVAHKFNYTAVGLETVGAAAELQAVVKTPPSELKTIWSEMPELWMEFNRSEEPVTSRQALRQGQRVLRYLLSTEREFLARDTRSVSVGNTSGPFAAHSQERNMDSTAVRVFIGSGEASALERKTLIYSLRKHTKRPLDLYVFNGTHNAIEHDDEPPKLAPMSLRIKYENFTEFSLYRFLIPQLCNFEGRAIFLDSDMVCLTDIGELFDMPMNGAAIMCSKAYRSGEWGTSVMLMDCSRCRFDLEQAFDEIDAGKYTYTDFTCFGPPYLDVHPLMLCELDPNWNVFDRHDENTKIIHYTHLTTQPWKYPGHPFGELWFQYFREAFAGGVITERDVQKATWRGYARLDILEASLPPSRVMEQPETIDSGSPLPAAERISKTRHWLKRLPRKLLKSG